MDMITDMKKCFFVIYLVFSFIPLSALDFCELQLPEGIWAAMCNDTFGTGNCLETDDLHTFAFHGGLINDFLYFSLLYDIYTFRGTEDGQQSRTDTALVSCGLHGSGSFLSADYMYAIGGILGIAGNLGGHAIQTIFHGIFDEYRHVPDIEDYDNYAFCAGISLKGDISLPVSVLSAGITLDSDFYIFPFSFSLRSGIFLEWKSFSEKIRQEIVWQFADPVSGFGTLKTVRDYNSGLCTFTTIRSGGLFFQTGYSFLNQIADGRIGYSWGNSGNSDRAERLWDSMEAGIEISRIGAETEYHSNSSLLLLFATAVENGYITAETKNGVIYKTDDANISTSSYGAGWEQHLSASGSAVVPFLGTGILCEIVRELDYTSFRSILRNEAVILSAELRPGIVILFPGNADGFQFGLRFTPYIILPVMTFGNGKDSPEMALAQKIRWGFRFGLCTMIK